MIRHPVHIARARPAPLHLASGLGLLALLLLPWAAVAQGGPRDPMQPPAVLHPPAAASPDAAAAPTLPESAQILIVDGRPYALIGSRRYAQGERLGSGPQALIVERVNEHGVWLRSREGLHALPLLNGVSKKPSVESTLHEKSQEKRDRP